MVHNKVRPTLFSGFISQYKGQKDIIPFEASENKYCGILIPISNHGCFSAINPPIIGMEISEIIWKLYTLQPLSLPFKIQ